MNRHVSFTLVVAVALGAAVHADAQRVAHARYVGSLMLGDARVELMAYDDGVVTASAGSEMSFALARWRGDELRAWLDTAGAVVRYSRAVDPDDEITLSTPIDGVWLVRKLTKAGSTYVVSVISPTSPQVVDATPTATQIAAFLRGLSRADTVMREMTPDSLLRAGPDRAPAGRARVAGESSCPRGRTVCETSDGSVELEPKSPRRMADARTRPSVLTQFVVSQSGRANPKSFRVLSSDDPALNEPARQIVMRTRYRPAERVDGRPVVQQVLHRIFFRAAAPPTQP